MGVNIRARIYGMSKAKAASPSEEQNGGSRIEESRKFTNSRSADRHRLSEETARVTHNGIEYDVELINVSGGGAMIGATFDAGALDALELHLGENGTIDCVVRWQKDARMGVEFAHETQLDCSADEQAILLREVISRTYGATHFAQEQQSSRVAEPEVRDERKSADHRRAKRHPLIWSGVFTWGRKSTQVRVRNISATGAMVQCSGGPAVGTDGVLQLSKDVSVPASVNWATGDQVGLRFHQHFEMGQLARSTPEVASTRWVRPSYLDRTKEESSPWDPVWQRLSVGELKHELEGFLKR